MLPASLNMFIYHWKPKFFGGVLSKKKHKNKFEELHHHQDQDHLWKKKSKALRLATQHAFASPTSVPRSESEGGFRLFLGKFWWAENAKGFLKNAKGFWKMPRMFENPEDFCGGGVRKCEFCIHNFLVMELWMASLKSWMPRKFSGCFLHENQMIQIPPCFFSEKNL